ncbi:DegV family protein, partial [Chloroflexota bacterium]
MVSKVVIVTDSIACLTREFVEQYDIKILPLNFYFGDKVYRDWVDITPTEVYELFLKDPEAFKTSPASPGFYLEAYREASNKAKNILCITLSSKMSTGFDMARAAKEQAKSEFPDTSIEVLDSQTVTAAEGFIALAAARAAAVGNNLDDVVNVAKEIKERVSFLLLLD